MLDIKDITPTPPPTATPSTTPASPTLTNSPALHQSHPPAIVSSISQAALLEKTSQPASPTVPLLRRLNSSMLPVVSRNSVSESSVLPLLLEMVREWDDIMFYIKLFILFF